MCIDLLWVSYVAREIKRRREKEWERERNRKKTEKVKVRLRERERERGDTNDRRGSGGEIPNQ